ncbi:MAG: glycosyltransferase family 39 protein [Clostridia bacterium]
MHRAIRIATLISLSLLCGLFALWAFGKENLNPLNLLSALLSVGLFGVCVVRFITRAMNVFAYGEDPSPDMLLGPRSLRRSFRHPWLQIALLVLLSRVAVLIVAYALSSAINGYSGGILDTMRGIWVRSDANSYLGIAQNWYVADGDPRFHIVFLPFYPIVIRAISFITGNIFAAAIITSCLCAAAAGVFFYELAALSLSRDDALRAVKYLFVLPAAFFFCAPMTESLFILLSAATLYFAQKKHILVACILAAFAAFTRSVGALLALPIAIECVNELCRRHRAAEKSGSKICVYIACLCIVPLGLIAYLGVNYAVTGDAFKFMQYQHEHWSQGLGLFWDTAAYQLDYLRTAIADGNMRTLWGLFFPNLLCSFGALAIVAAAAKRLRPSHTAYFLAYYVFSIGATWLLSAPRYLTAALPLALALPMLIRGRFADIAATTLLVALQIGYLAMFVAGYPVY